MNETGWTWTFRRAERHDVPAIVALVESAYRGEVSRAGWTTEADLLDGQRTDPAEVETVIADPASRILLAERDGTLEGSVMLARKPDAVHVGMFAVRPTLQGKGLGKALLNEVERITRDEHLATHLEMTVIAQRTDLITWYQRRGYQVTDKTEPFPYGDPRFGLPRRDDLFFRVLEKRL
ncbi:MAG: GNAT family N-acetyltransferase [Polyangiales bacterium]